MAEMERYCKAYLAAKFREYSGWKEDLGALRKETEIQDGQEVEIPRTELGDDDILYLQENYVVTDGVFKDENVIFDTVTSEWKTFCTDVLEFEIPDYVLEAEQEAAADQAQTAAQPALEHADQSTAPTAQD